VAVSAVIRFEPLIGQARTTPVVVPKLALSTCVIVIRVAVDGGLIPLRLELDDGDGSVWKWETTQRQLLTHLAAVSFG
jgi:hypothetical protein